MTKTTMLPAEGRAEGGRRRLHLRDITHEEPLEEHTIGAELRAARLRRGEEIRSIAHILHIRRDYLEALEESRYESLPGKAYALGFVRSYAEYLGLDSVDIVERYKTELDAHLAEGDDALPFPEIQEQARLPRGTFLVVALVVMASVYGIYLMTRSADRMMAERVPDVPGQMEVNVASNSPDERPASLSGDPASASTRPMSNAAVTQPSGEATSGASTVYAVPPVAAPAPAETSTQVAALTPAPVDAASASAAETAAVAPALPDIPLGHVYGAENTDSRVAIRARKNDAWIRVEDAQGHVLIERVLQAGDVYHAPNVPGTILVARDASAFEILVDDKSLGLAGPPTLVLTGKSLEPTALLAALPRSMPTTAEEEAAIAPAAAAAH